MVWGYIHTHPGGAAVRTTSIASIVFDCCDRQRYARGGCSYRSSQTCCFDPYSLVRREQSIRRTESLLEVGKLFLRRQGESTKQVFDFNVPFHTTTTAGTTLPGQTHAKSSTALTYGNNPEPLSFNGEKGTFVPEMPKHISLARSFNLEVS